MIHCEKKLPDRRDRMQEYDGTHNTVYHHINYIGKHMFAVKIGGAYVQYTDNGVRLKRVKGRKPTSVKAEPEQIKKEAVERFNSIRG